MSETVSYDRCPATCGDDDRPALSLAASGAGERITFSKAALWYVADGGEAMYLLPLAAFFAGRFVDEITQADIDAAAAKICANLAPATRNRRVYTPASAVLKFSAERGWRTSLRIQRPRATKRVVALPSQPELDAFARAAGPGLKQVIRFKLETDATEHEILSLDWGEVNVSRKRAVLQRADGETRVVALSSALVEMFVRRSGNQIGRVFRSDNAGKPYSTNGSYGGRLKAAFEGASNRSGTRITFSMLHLICRARQVDASRDIGSAVDG